MGEQAAGDPVGQRRLADPGGAADQPGMVQAPRGDRRREGRLPRPRGRSSARVSRGRGMPGRSPGSTSSAARSTCAWSSRIIRNCRDIVRLARGRHPAPTPQAASPAAPLTPLARRPAVRQQVRQARRDGLADRGLDRIGIAARVDHRAALRLGPGDRQEGVAQPGVEVEGLGLEPVGRPAPSAPARGRAGEAGLGGEVEDQGQVGPGRADDDPLQGGDDARIEAARGALVGPGRVDEAVAQHGLAAAERRADQPVEMVDPGGAEQQGLGEGPVGLGDAGEQRRRGSPRPGASRRARGSRTRPGRMRARRVAARRAIWVDLPAPSPPSKVMKAPRASAGSPKRGTITARAGHDGLAARSAGLVAPPLSLALAGPVEGLADEPGAEFQRRVHRPLRQRAGLHRGAGVERLVEGDRVAALDAQGARPAGPPPRGRRAARYRSPWR